MKVMQQSNVPLTIARFDTKESVTLEMGKAVELDEETAKYLLEMKAFDCSAKSEVSIANFVEIK